jgi:hypothetical protein
MAEKTADDDDMKRRFREALERKQGKGTEGAASVDSAGKSVHAENVTKQRTFRRRAGG